MDKKQFLKLCNTIFTEYGYVKKGKSTYYWNGNDLQGEISIIKSSYSSEHFIDVSFYICDLNFQNNVPTPPNAEFSRRIRIPNKASKSDPLSFTAYIDYELYSEDELKKSIKADFDANILPVIQYGKVEFLERNDFDQAGGYFIGFGKLHDKDIVFARLKQKGCNYYFIDHPRGDIN